MQNNTINQVNIPYPPQDQNQPVNIPPNARLYLISQVPQPYSPQLLPQQYIIQQPGQPVIANQQPQPYYILQQPVQPINPSVQPYSFRQPDESIDNQPLKPLLIKPLNQNGENKSNDDLQYDEFIIKDSKYYKNKLCCPRIWTFFMLVPTIIDICLQFGLERIPIPGIIGCLVYIIVGLLIIYSAKICDVKKYIVALVLYIIYFVFVCIYYTCFYFYCSSNCYDYRYIDNIKTILFTLYLIDAAFDSITLFLLCYYKREFNIDLNQENEKLAPSQNE